MSAKENFLKMRKCLLIQPQYYRKDGKREVGCGGSGLGSTGCFQFLGLPFKELK